MVRLAFVALLSACVCIPAFASDNLSDDTRTRAGDAYIRTLTTRIMGDDMLPPVITSESQDGVLELAFDELAEDYRQLRYEIIHCDSRWRPTATLTSQEYIAGGAFNQADITDYEYSVPGLSTRYVHYRIPFPNSDIRPSISGNYVLRVFPYDDPDTTLAQFRFMVSEQQTPVNAQVNTVTDIDYNESHQQLTFDIDTRNSHPEVYDPFSRLKVVVYQNRRYDNAVVLDHPSRVEGRNKVVFDHMMPLIFPAGNEYRRFETVSTTYTPMRIDVIEYHYPYYHMFVSQDKPRSDMPYSYDSTQKGRFRIRNANSDADDIGAEYVVTHFQLDMPQLPEGSNVYIEGGLTYNGADPAALMQYDSENGCYRRSLLLKQGSYNYQYVVGSDSRGPFDTGRIEGDKYETANEYLICVYYQAPGERYERLMNVSPVIIR